MRLLTKKLRNIVEEKELEKHEYNKMVKSLLKYKKTKWKKKQNEKRKN